MKRLTSSLLVSAILLLVGCTDRYDSYSEGNVENRKICLGASIDQLYQTRASATGFADGDQMGVYIVDYHGDNPSVLLPRGNRGDNIRYTYHEANNSWEPAYELYWKDKTTHVDIYAYYPFSVVFPENTSEWPFSVQSDQSLEAKGTSLCTYEQSDLLWGKATDVAPTAEVINLSMRHRMSSLRIELVEGSNFANGEFAQKEKTVVVKNTKRSATVDLSTGTVTASGSAKSSITPYRNGNQYRAIVVPQTIAANTTILDINMGGQLYSFKKAESVEFTSGRMYTFTIRIDKRDDTGEYKFTLIGESILPWENDDASHDATMMEYVTINSTPGHLKDSIMAANKDYRELQNLKITGEINAYDFYFMRDEMPNLFALNMKEVRIEGCEYYNEETFETIKTADDEIPQEGMACFFEKGLRSKLTKLILPDQLKKIGFRAFRDCWELSGSLLIPEGVTYIGNDAFSACRRLDGTLYLPSTLEWIGDNAFRWTKFNSELFLPDKLRHIGSYAFSENSNLYGELRLPARLTELGDGTFTYTQSFTGTLIVPQGVKTIPADCFHGSGITSIELHDGITSIEYGAFWDAGLKGELYLPANLEIIGSLAFANCDLRGTLVLPQKLRIIGTNAFYNNWRLMGTIVLPPDLLHLSRGAFANCWSIEGVVINENLESIGATPLIWDGTEYGGGAFQNCFGIGSIVSNASIPPIVLAGAFEGLPKDNFTLEVPEASLAQYQTASGWNEFKRIAAHHELVCRPRVACAINTEAQRRLVLNAEGDWEVASIPDWCSLSQMSGSKKTELTLTIHQMLTGSGERDGEIVFRLKDKDYTSKCIVRQYDYQYAEDEIVNMQKATRGYNGGINIFIVGDGYDAKEISEGNYLKDMQDEIEYFFGIEPYKTYRDYFNVYTGIAVSTESGVGTINTIRYNRFETTYTGGVGLKADYDALFNYAKRASTISDSNIDQSLIIVVPNSTDYGGICQMWESGAAIAFCPKSTYGYPLDSRGVIQHEAGGHGFGKLGDEYIYHNAFLDFCTCTCCAHDISEPKSIGWYDNLETTGKMHQVGWSHLIFDPRYADLVDIFEGGYMHSRGVFRSEQNSCMNNDIPYYSTISRESIVRRIKRYAGEDFSFEDFVAHDSREAGATTRAMDAPWKGYQIRHYQHMPVIHRGSPEKSKSLIYK